MEMMGGETKQAMAVMARRRRFLSAIVRRAAFAQNPCAQPVVDIRRYAARRGESADQPLKGEQPGGDKGENRSPPFLLT